MVVRAFSHIQEELLVSRAGRNPGVWAVGYAADALEERPRIESLLEATGYVPVFVGTLAESSLLDPGGSVFPHLLTRLVISNVLLPCIDCLGCWSDSTRVT